MKLTTIFIVIFKIFIILQYTNGKKILVVQFFGSKSHVLSYLGLLEELSNRGHEVTFLAPVKDFAKAGIKEISTLDDKGKLFGDRHVNFFERKEKNIKSNPFDFMTRICPSVCAKLYDRPNILGLMNDTWDLVILQPLFNECALGLVYKVMQKSNCSLILFSRNEASNILVTPFGGYYPQSTIPSPYFLGTELNFLERIQNVLAEIKAYYQANYQFYPAMEAVYRKKLGNDIPSVVEILSSASIMLSNEHFSMATPKPNYPDIVEIGGMNSQPAQPLPEDLENFVAGAGKDGFIYFSFGSIVKGDKMSESKRQLFQNVFKKLKQRIIWIYDGKEIENLPSNIKLAKWVPQQDIMGHPKIKLFITHCGYGGLEHAIYHGVPLIGIPIFGDQERNAINAKKQGILIHIDWNELTEEKLEAGIKEILNNTSYREKVKKFSSLLKDQINNPLDRAVWWIEYVMRNNGLPEIRSSSRNMNFIQFHSLDVFGFFLGVILLILFVVIKIVKVFINLIFGTKTITIKSKKH